jgi:E3 ubiquitin-protein ligase TRIP12
MSAPPPPATARTSSSARSRKQYKTPKAEQNAAAPGVPAANRTSSQGPDRQSSMSDDSNGDALRDRYDDEDDDDDDDPFRHGFLSRAGGAAGLHGSLRALGGMLSGVTSRLRSILEQLKQRDDPSLQLIALQELSELLLVSTEDNLVGHFAPDQFLKELIVLMQGDGYGGGNSDMMLLACRCIANMMEALPSSAANVVYSGAVPILCQKLLEIEFIDIAEQAISVGQGIYFVRLVLILYRLWRRSRLNFHLQSSEKEDSRPFSPI